MLGKRELSFENDDIKDLFNEFMTDLIIPKLNASSKDKENINPNIDIISSPNPVKKLATSQDLFLTLFSKPQPKTKNQKEEKESSSNSASVCFQNFTSKQGDNYRDRFMQTFGTQIANQPKRAPIQPSLSFSEKYELKNTIGEGANAVVKLLKDRETGTHIAMKSFKLKANWPSADTEAKFLNMFCHKNIIQFHRLYKSMHSVHMLIEYFHGHTLSHYLKKSNGKLSEEDTRKIFKQLLAAIVVVHSKGVSHLDIKPDNLLVDEDLNLKIIDFAFAVHQQRPEKVRIACGTPSYMSPELLMKEPVLPHKADIWAIGAIAYKCISGKLPYKGKKTLTIQVTTQQAYWPE